MKIVVNNRVVLIPPGDVHGLYQSPIWEVEIQSDVLDSPEFEAELRNDSNFIVSAWHHNNLRSMYNSTGIVSSWLAQIQPNLLLDIVSSSVCFAPLYYKSLDDYGNNGVCTSSVLRDQPGFEMIPHLDNRHVMAQLVVNLLQDYETATEFYYFNSNTPCYRAPLKKNHGVVFLNTPGSVHGIANVTTPRWTWAAGLLI